MWLRAHSGVQDIRGTHFRDLQKGAEGVEDRTAVRWGLWAVSLSISAAYRPPRGEQEGVGEGKWCQEEADLTKET